MEVAYVVTWLVLYVCGGTLIALCVYPLRKHFFIAFFTGALGTVWILIPIPFTEENWAPLFVTLFFQVLLDPEADYAFAATFAVLGTAVVVAATLLLYALTFTFSRFVRPRTKVGPSSLPEPAITEAVIEKESK